LELIQKIRVWGNLVKEVWHPDNGAPKGPENPMKWGVGVGNSPFPWTHRGVGHQNLGRGSFRGGFPQAKPSKKKWAIEIGGTTNPTPALQQMENQDKPPNKKMVAIQ